MPCCVNLINVFFRYHYFWNKKFPDQVTNFQFEREPPPLDAITTVWFKHELVQVHSVKYFTDCISGFVYFLNGKFTPGVIFLSDIFIYNTKLVDHTNMSKLLRPHVGDSSFIVIFNLKTAMRHAVIIWLFSFFLFYFSFLLYVWNRPGRKENKHGVRSVNIPYRTPKTISENRYIVYWSIIDISSKDRSS